MDGKKKDRDFDREALSQEETDALLSALNNRNMYDHDLDYLVPGIDISEDELEHIVLKADIAIELGDYSPPNLLDADNIKIKEWKEKKAIACMKKAQALQMLHEIKCSGKKQ